MDDGELRSAINRDYRRDESRCVSALLERVRLTPSDAERVRTQAFELAQAVRSDAQSAGGFEALMREYDLSNQEGILLMSLAEALLRIPDTDTAERLIRDRLSRGDWDRHLGHSQSSWVNASTWGLLLGGRVLGPIPTPMAAPAVWQRLAARLGGGTVRRVLKNTMQLLAGVFVIGRDMPQAMARARPSETTCYSFDCLGEAARTASAAQRYFNAYLKAIDLLAAQGRSASPLSAPSISVKLSALHPRYEFNQAGRVRTELAPRLMELVSAARTAGIGLTLDAEEADRLDLMLDLFAQTYACDDLVGWDGFGLAVQAYQKRAPAVIAWLIDLAEQHGRRIPVRLVKGAYWDSEIKRAQERGLDDYPVYTRKVATDVAYLACARQLLGADGALFPQFATHNAYSLSYLLHCVGTRTDVEFQRLHGMGEALYAAVNQRRTEPILCRIYAPVGRYDQLLPYLVRRLLENGANSSFVNQLAQPGLPLEKLLEDPVVKLSEHEASPNPAIPLPRDLYANARRNSCGLDLSDRAVASVFQKQVTAAAAILHQAGPLVDGVLRPGVQRSCFSPADTKQLIGMISEADTETIATALDSAYAQAPHWDAVPALQRAKALERAAELMEQRRVELAGLVIREAGRCIADALSEVREAVDYCRYYAQQARSEFAVPRRLTGPTGEDNQLSLHGRGVFLCISPWNFPLAIFTGQIVAALVAGNTVIAKPAGQTPLVAYQLVRLLHEAGIPTSVLQFLPGSGAVIGAQLLSDERIAGVVLTGSTATAWKIQRQLAERRGSIVPLIAETGGQNVMIVDSSALPEQVVGDVISSAFNSAGQRCSALRVLFLQKDIADTVLEMLAGAMDELRIGDPGLLETDIGPVIAAAAVSELTAHIQHLRTTARLIKTLALPGSDNGHFVAPVVFEIERLDQLQGEVFGPVLHVIRYGAETLDQVIDAVNASGYGLTLGVHSRIEATWTRVQQRARVGNLYINRNMIGAVVGVQPFGGEGRSGTGPKAGGPYYLPRFAVERTVSNNTAAIGGNAQLLGGEDGLTQSRNTNPAYV